MSNLIEKSFLLGLGALSMTKSSAEKFINDAIKQSQITPEEGQSLANTLEEEGSKVRKNLEDTVTDIIKSRGASIFPVYKNVKDLEAKVAELEAKVAELEAKAAKN